MVIINLKCRLPVINNYVSIPDKSMNRRLTLNEALIIIADSAIEFIDGRKYLSFPEFERSAYPEDWYSELRAFSHL